MPQKMGFDFGLEKADNCFKRKFRWLVKIPSVSAEGINALPPLKAARPNLSFKEMEAQHLNEIIYYPSKPDWKPISIVLYDIKKSQHPVFNWFKQIYNPCTGTWKPSVTPSSDGVNRFKRQINLEMYDGCGSVIERWQYHNAWPQSIEFGELDMGNTELATLEITLRYDRATITSEC